MPDETYDPKELYKNTSNDEIARMFADIADNVKVGSSRGGIELNDWEEEFVQDIRVVFDRGSKLSGKRLVRLRLIWDRC